MSDQQEPQLWGKLELMGHKVLVGLITETTLAGKGVLRVDIPGPDGSTSFTQFYSPDALYCLAPVSKEVALELAKHQATAPVSAYDISDLVARKLKALVEPAIPGPTYNYAVSVIKGDHDSSGEVPGNDGDDWYGDDPGNVRAGDPNHDDDD